MQNADNLVQFCFVFVIILKFRKKSCVFNSLLWYRSLYVCAHSMAFSLRAIVVVARTFVVSSTEIKLYFDRRVWCIHTIHNSSAFLIRLQFHLHNLNWFSYLLCASYWIAAMPSSSAAVSCFIVSKDHKSTASQVNIVNHYNCIVLKLY